VTEISDQRVLIPRHSVFFLALWIPALKLLALIRSASYIEMVSPMASRHKISLFILVVVLVPVLLGTTPLNLFHKLSDHCPFSQEKQIQRTSSCLFFSIVSQDDIDFPNLHPALPKEQSIPLLRFSLKNSTPAIFIGRSSPLLC
jgi:hypothetical protein